jgi:hypothetical protein
VLEADAACAQALAQRRRRAAVMARHVRCLRVEIGIEHERAVQPDLHAWSDGADAARVPTLGRVELLGRRERAVEAAGEFRRQRLGAIAQVHELQLEAVEGGVPRRRRAQRDTRVAEHGEKNLELEFEVGVGALAHEPGAAHAGGLEHAVAHEPGRAVRRRFGEILPCSHAPALRRTVVREELLRARSDRAGSEQWSEPEGASHGRGSASCHTNTRAPLPKLRSSTSP